MAFKVLGFWFQGPSQTDCIEGFRGCREGHRIPSQGGCRAGGQGWMFRGEDFVGPGLLKTRRPLQSLDLGFRVVGFGCIGGLFWT